MLVGSRVERHPERGEEVRVGEKAEEAEEVRKRGRGFWNGAKARGSSEKKRRQEPKVSLRAQSSFHFCLSVLWAFPRRKFHFFFSFFSPSRSPSSSLPLAPSLIAVSCPSSPPMASDQEAANALKVQGNKAFAQHEWPAAVDFYSQAIEKYDKEPSFFCNRAQVRLTTELPGQKCLRAWICLANISCFSRLAGTNQTRGFRFCCRRRHHGFGIGPELHQGQSRS